MEPGKSLTRREFEEVVRRASELAAREPDAGEGAVDEAELFRIAREVGLPERQVRRALSEMRETPVARGPLDAVFGPCVVRVSRVVPGQPAELARTLDEFLVAGQLLQPVRKTASLLQYRPPMDWFSRIARAASATSQRYYMASARRVEVRLEEVEPGRSLVEIEVDPGTRGEYAGGALLASLAGGGAATFFAAAGAATLAPLALALGAGATAGAGIVGLIVWAVARAHRKRLHEVRSEVEGVLDRLEAGETLEPPPASWRRWIRRHVKTITSDLFGTGAGERLSG